MAAPAYRRVVLKISGESLKGSRDLGIDPSVISYIAGEIVAVTSLGVQVAVVVGGGNIWRGADYEAVGMDRATADAAGMLATIINALALQDALERSGLQVRTQTAITMPSVAEPYIRRRAIRHMEKGRTVIFAAGTGQAFQTTDTAAALRALEIGAGALLMAKNGVDGVYDSDPKHNPNARKFDRLTHHQALTLRLKALDSSALSYCMENDLPIVVFNMFQPGNLRAVVEGRQVGTIITESEPVRTPAAAGT